MSILEIWEIPDQVDAPFPHPVGASLRLAYGVHGREAQRTTNDMIRSLKKHVADILDTYGSRFLAGFDSNGEPAQSDSWEVRLWDEQGTFRYPFARVARIGPETSGGPPSWAEVSQPVAIHLYPWPQDGRENAELVAQDAATLIHDALKWGTLRGRAQCVPLWDFGGQRLYEDSDQRHPSDYFRVVDLTTDRLVDLEDDRAAAGIVNFRAQWRRAPSLVPGQVVESVRVSAHPS